MHARCAALFTALSLVACSSCTTTGGGATGQSSGRAASASAQPIIIPVPSGPKAEPTTCTRASGPCGGEAKLTSGGRERTLRFHFPKPKDAKPGLVIALHGRGETGRAFEITSHLDKVSNENDFVVVYPDGIEKSWDSYGSKGGAAKDGVDDVAFVSALIDYGVTTLGADGARVVVMGFSNGAMMTERIGCELADKVIAIGAVSGPMASDEAPLCKPSRPLSVILFHGDADKRVPYKGRDDNDRSSELLSAPATIAKWAALEHCGPTATSTDEPDVDPEDATKTKRMTYPGCNKGVKVVLFTVEGGEHRWPEGPNVPLMGKKEGVSRDVDAGETIWKLAVQ